MHYLTLAYRRILQSPITLGVLLLAVVLQPFKQTLRTSFAWFPSDVANHLLLAFVFNFLHADVWHLFYDFCGVLIAGVILEPILGRKRFAILTAVILFAVTLTGAYAYYPSISLGLSGLQQGLVGGLIATIIFVYRMYLLGGAWLLLQTAKLVGEIMGQSSFDWASNLFSSSSSPGNNVAYWCHVAGCVTGFMLAFMMADSVRNTIPEKPRS